MLQDFSTDIAKEYSDKTGNADAALDAGTLLKILEIVSSVITMFKDCQKTPAQALAIAKKPGLWQRLLLRNAVMNHVGRANFRQSGNELMESVLLSAGKLNKNQVAELYAEVD